MDDDSYVSTPSTGYIPTQSTPDYQTPSRSYGTSWKDSSTAAGVRSAGSALSSYGSSQLSGVQSTAAANADRQTPMYHKGGVVRKSGKARLLKGEVVIPRSKAKAGRKLLKGRKENRKGGRNNAR